MVKIDDQVLGKQYGVHALPALLFFKRGDDNPIIFAGDLKKSNKYCLSFVEFKAYL